MIRDRDAEGPCGYREVEDDAHAVNLQDRIVRRWHQPEPPRTQVCQHRSAKSTALGWRSGVPVEDPHRPQGVPTARPAVSLLHIEMNPSGMGVLE